MKYFLKSLCLLGVVLLPFTTYSEVTGEVVVLQGAYQLSSAHVNKIDGARPLFRNESGLIREISVQKDGAFIVFVANTDVRNPFNNAIYVVNTNEMPLKAHRLTQDKFHDVLNIDISQNGDIVFTNTPFIKRDPPLTTGIHYISTQELTNASPKITLLKEVKAYRVKWSPDGKRIAYDTKEGIFLFNLETKKRLKVNHGGSYPAFSPNGAELAFVFHDLGEVEAREIRVISLIRPRLPRRFSLEGKEHASFRDLKWSPDSRYIVYSIYSDEDYWEHHFAIRFNSDDGSHKKILTTAQGNNGIKSVRRFDWAPSAYAVEPVNRLTTLWGKLKTDP